MKITIVQPYIASQAVFVQGYIGSARVSANLGPLALAGLTPDEHDVKVVNEHVEAINYDEAVDLVGISTMTSSALRAYEIADRFRERGVPVILGGIHPSLLPEEAIDHADAVVIGEAEYTWRTCLSDFEKGTLKRFYRADRLTDMSDLASPRRDLELTVGYHDKVEASRGCPFKCAFCATNIHFGSTHRVRPIDDIVKEIEAIYKHKEHRILFTDDNIIGNVEFAEKLFRALIPLKIRWYSQCSINVANKPELAKLAKESGCSGLSIGFESLSLESLRSVQKTQNSSARYEEQIRQLRDNGIEILANFVFGFDHDDKSVFERTAEFIVRNRLRGYLTILTPYPATVLRDSMIKQGRLLHSEWDKYDVAHCVFKPRLMAPEELEQGFLWAYKQIYPNRVVSAKSPEELYGDNQLTKLSRELVRIRRDSDGTASKRGVGIKELLGDLYREPSMAFSLRSSLDDTLSKGGYVLDGHERCELSRLLDSALFGAA